MAIISLAVGIIMLLGVALAFIPMGITSTGLVFALISAISMIIATLDKENPKLANGAIVVNIIAIALNGILGYAAIQ